MQNEARVKQEKMKIKITFTPDESERAGRLQEMICKLFGCCRIHRSQSGEHGVIYLTFGCKNGKISS